MRAAGLKSWEAESEQRITDERTGASKFFDDRSREFGYLAALTALTPPSFNLATVPLLGASGGTFLQSHMAVPNIGKMGVDLTIDSLLLTSQRLTFQYPASTVATFAVSEGINLRSRQAKSYQ